MGWLITIIFFSKFWLTLGNTNEASAKDPLAIKTIPNNYIVSLDPNAHLQNGRSSPHAELRRSLELHGINATITRVYNNPVFCGAAVLLSNNVDSVNLKKLTVVAAIDPVNVYLSPNIAFEDAKKLSKRARPNRPHWTHTMTGVDRLHAEGNYGQDVIIAIIDSGIDYTHPALGGGIGPGYKVVGGYDFVGDDFTGEPDSPPARESPHPLDTCNGHGTLAAGVIGADPNNPYGIPSVAPAARINAYRVTGCVGGTSDEVIIAALLRAYEDGNDVISLPSAYRFAWGEGAIASVAKKIAENGRVIVSSAGNDGQYGSWYAGDIGNAPGIIYVGNIQRAFRNAYQAKDAIMAVTSSYGPSNSMHMRPTLSTPGKNLLSTFPIEMGAFKVASRTSMAVPFVAGSVALWLRAKGRTRESAWGASVAFQNTAYIMRQSQRADSLTETASHQGAGLIQVYEAIHSAGTMSPSELLLNDTKYPRLSWKVKIWNSGQRPVRYRLTHIPAGTVPTIQGIENIVGSLPLIRQPVAVNIKPNELTVAAGSSKSVRIVFRPPTGLDPATFPVYSGYIRATSEAGLVLQSTYLGVAAALRNMRVFDTTNRFSSRRLPLLKGVNPLEKPRTYTMQGDDVPELIFRLAAGSPLLRLDLVDAKIGRPPHGGAAHFKLWGGICGTLNAALKRCIVQCTTPGGWSYIVRMRGSIHEAPYMPRNLRSAPNSNSIPVNFWRVTQFADGQDIPDGSYRLLLGALKITGKTRRLRDWENWLSPPINVRRTQV